MKAWLAVCALAVWCGAANMRPPEQTATLFVVGDLRGVLAPCGCTSPMTGGIQRLGTVLRAFESHGRNTLVMNGGLFPDHQSSSAAAERQLVLKAETLAEAMRSLDAAAINIGPEEANRGQGLITSLVNLTGAKIISGSLEPSATNHLPASVVSGPFLVGGLSVDSGALSAALGQVGMSVDQGAKSLCAEARARSLEPVILLRGGAEVAKELAMKNPTVRLIAYSSAGTPPPPERVGSTWLASPGDLGRRVLRIQWTGTDFAKPVAISLDPSIKDDPTVSRLYRAYLRRVDRERLLSAWPRTDGPGFAGAKACFSCHASAFKVWEKSGHSHAYATLQDRGHGLDPDCVACHVTGLSSKRGFRSLLATPRLANVTCESCHGPSLAHARNPGAYPLPHLGQEACLPCHTPDNSPNFQFKTYWPKVIHH